MDPRRARGTEHLRRRGAAATRLGTARPVARDHGARPASAAPDTVALVPETLRQRLDLPFSRAERRAWDVLAAASRASGPLVRGPLRNFGPNYVRWRREALARGDVAKGAPAPRPAVA